MNFSLDILSFASFIGQVTAFSDEVRIIRNHQDVVGSHGIFCIGIFNFFDGRFISFSIKKCTKHLGLWMMYISKTFI